MYKQRKKRRLLQQRTQLRSSSKQLLLRLPSSANVATLVNPGGSEIVLPPGLTEQKAKVLHAIKQATKAVHERSVAQAELEMSQVKRQGEQGHLWSLEIKHDAMRQVLREVVSERDHIKDERAILCLECARISALEREAEDSQAAAARMTTKCSNLSSDKLRLRINVDRWKPSCLGCGSALPTQTRTGKLKTGLSKVRKSTSTPSTCLLQVMLVLLFDVLLVLPSAKFAICVSETKVCSPPVSTLAESPEFGP